MEQNTKNIALLVLDMQAGILSAIPAAAAVSDTISKVISFARDNNLSVFYSAAGFRKGAPEISPVTKVSALREAGLQMQTRKNL